MCFEVVLCHFWSSAEFPKILLPFQILRSYAVPVFMFMSFFLTQKNFLKKDKNYAAHRIFKLAVPHFAWAFIYFFAYKFHEFVLHTKIATLKDFALQIFLGHSRVLDAVLWFQVNLIALTILFFAVFYFLSEKSGTILLIFFSFVALILQYSGINQKIFGGMEFEFCYPLGRFSEMLPVATCGFLVSRFGLEKIFRRRGINLLFFFALSSAAIFSEMKFGLSGRGFGYSGVWKILAGYAITSFAFNCDFEKFTKKFPRSSEIITRYTQGIYCSHLFVGRYATAIFSRIGIQPGFFYQCVLIYAAAFAVFFVTDKIPSRRLKLIF
jgi:fucose 4-O-acetylase-like acetyltransferase